MTISEAAQLVIQATSLAEGGDVFILDMGDPVKIKDLAEQMIRLSGLKIKNEDNCNGDMEIVFTGLRPGEKLSEELLIDNNSKTTSHPLIYKAEEKYIKYEKLLPLIEKIEESLINYNLDKSLSILKQIVPEWE